MKSLAGVGAVVLILLGAILTWNLAAVVVSQHEQAVIVELGRPVRELKEPGLYWKTPFVQNAVYFDRRLLLYDAQGTDVITQDKKTLHVDNYARWRIIEPMTFLERVATEARAQQILDAIIYSELRVEIGKNDLVQIVDTNRETIHTTVTAASDGKAREYGIEIVDVRVKRADLPDENQVAVFERMRSERRRQATQYRSEGEEEAAKIRAQTDKERSIILAEAYRQAQEVRGEGEAQAITIYTGALGRDPEFYRFVRSLETYSKAFQDDKTRLILSPDSELLQYFKGSLGRAGTAGASTAGAP